MEPFEITILGSGSIVPSPQRGHSSIYVRHNGDTLLWDCGEGTQKQIQKAGLSFMKIDRIFITHWHADHFAGLIGLIETLNLEGRERKLEIYGPQANRFISILSDLSWYDFGFDIEANDVNFEEDIETTLIDADNYTISSIPTVHSVPSVAYCLKEKDRWNINEDKAANKNLYPGPEMGELKKKGRIEKDGKIIELSEVADLNKGRKVVYTGDTRPSDNVERLSKNADMLIHDATFLESEGESNHSTVKEAAQLANRANVKKLVLMHYSRRYDNPEILVEEALEHHDNVELAKDLNTVDF